MRMRKLATSALAAAALGSGIAIVASPGWAAADPVASDDVSAQACGVRAWAPTQHGRTLNGRAGRGGCAAGNTVNYLWGRVWRHIPYYPDALHAEKSKRYVTNGYLDARGPCGKRAIYYTQAADSRGNTVESARVTRC